MTKNNFPQQQSLGTTLTNVARKNKSSPHVSPNPPETNTLSCD